MQELNEALERTRQETAALSTQLQRTETALYEERAAYAATQETLAVRVTEVAQLGERVAGLNARLVEHEAHAQSRDALEHYGPR